MRSHKWGPIETVKMCKHFIQFHWGMATVQNIYIQLSINLKKVKYTEQ